VLDREAVDEFMITGHSQGTPHAMAAAYVHPDRCVGLGLNAPLLPTAVCHEEGLQGAHGADSLFSTTTLAKPYMAWYFTLYHLGVVTFSPALSIRPLISAGPKLKEEPEFPERLRDTLARFKPSMCVSGTPG
jgi:pimeloyl-ACP methyl ester carboxylesterase